MRRAYAHSPIIEAICEIQFERDTPWDLAMPGLIYAKVATHDFSVRKPARGVELTVASGPTALEHQLRTTDRMQFWRSDERALIQVGPQLLTVNHLRPYPSWEQFRALIEQALGAYREVVNPTEIHRVELRYINRIDLPGGAIELTDYFRFYPDYDEAVFPQVDAFIAGIRIPSGSTDRLQVELASALPETPDTGAVVLDLRYFHTQPGAATQDGLIVWLDAAHERIEAAFEACITERLRELFGEVRT